MAALVVARLARRQMRRERIFRDRMHPFDRFDDIELYQKFRFRQRDIILLTDEVAARLEPASGRGKGLPASLAICIALRFYASSSFQDVIGETVGIDQATVSRTITRVTDALLGLAPQWIKLPSQREADAMKSSFHLMANFPNVIGCIDGTHIKIVAPAVNEHEFVNRKNYHSINVQIICDANLNIINSIARWPGSTHDARILRESNLFQAFETNPPLHGYILGDSGYMLRDWLLTPILNPTTTKSQAFNDAHTSTRCTVERCIGVLKRRWSCLHRGMAMKPAKVCKIITVCIMLHNRANALNLQVFGDQPDPNTQPPNQAFIAPQATATVTERARAAIGKQERERIIQRYF